MIFEFRCDSQDYPPPKTITAGDQLVLSIPKSSSLVDELILNDDPWKKSNVHINEIDLSLERECLLGSLRQKKPPRKPVMTVSYGL